MPDLRTLPNVLARHGDIVTPPLEAVVRRARRARARRVVRNTALVVVVALLTPAAVDWVTNGDESSHVRLVDRTTSGPDAEAQALGSTATGPVLLRRTTAAAASTNTTTSTTLPPLSCRPGRNGGRTDLGVTATSIKIVMTETLESPTRYTTVDADPSVRQLFDEVNRAGGICGRRIDYRLANAVWGPLPWEPGADVFAGIAGPGDPAVDERSQNGDLDRDGVPIAGGDGRTAAQHRLRWLWPNGLTATALTRIALADAHARLRARSFALVYDADEPLGREALAAFQAYAADLTGYAGTRPKVHVQAVRKGSDHSEAALQFNTACAVTLCDHVVLAMPADTALEWLATTPPTQARIQTTLVPPQLTPFFWEQCLQVAGSRRCQGLHVWSATSSPLADVSPACSARDAAGDTLAVIVSACALVKAIRQVGPYLTRARVQEAMDKIAAQHGLVPPLIDGSRFPLDGASAKRARAVRPEYGASDEGPFGSRFVRLVDAGSGSRADPKSDRG